MSKDAGADAVLVKSTMLDVSPGVLLLRTHHQQPAQGRKDLESSMNSRKKGSLTITGQGAQPGDVLRMRGLDIPRYSLLFAD